MVLTSVVLLIRVFLFFIVVLSTLLFLNTCLYLNLRQWDIRTFHLLDTCTSLDQCRSIFNNRGDVIYGGEFLKDQLDQLIKGFLQSIKIDELIYQDI